MTVTPLAAQLVETLLLLFDGFSRSFGRWLPSHMLQQCGGHHGLILLQGVQQRSQRRMLVADHVGEGVIPAFADVVGTFPACERRLMLRPRRRREEWRRPAGALAAAADHVCHASDVRRFH